MLAAAEKRARQSAGHGVSEKKAQEILDREKREALLSKINAIYKKKGEETPVTIALAGVDTLKKHLDFLHSNPQATSSVSASASASASMRHPTHSSLPSRAAAAYPGPLLPEAVRVLDMVRGNPALPMLQDLARQNPNDWRHLVQELLKDHASVALREPRLASEIEKILLASPAAGSSQSSAVGAAANGHLSGATMQQTAPAFVELPETPAQRRALLIQKAKMEFCLNEEQMRSLLDLEELGFDYGRVLEAFLLCDKNQEMAANFLFTEEARTEDQPQDASTQSAVLSQQEMEAVSRIEALGFDRATSLNAFLRCGRDEEVAANQLLL